MQPVCFQKKKGDPVTAVCLFGDGWEESRRSRGGPGVVPDAGEGSRRGGHNPDAVSRSALTSHREQQRLNGRFSLSLLEVPGEVWGTAGSEVAPGVFPEVLGRRRPRGREWSFCREVKCFSGAIPCGSGPLP